MATGYGLKLYNYRVFFENNSYDQTIYGLIGDKIRSFNRGTGAFTEIGGAYTIFDRFFVSNDRNFIYFSTSTGSSYQLNKLPITGGSPQNYSYGYPSVSTLLGELGGAVFWHQSAFDAYKLYSTVAATGFTSNYALSVDSIRMIDGLLFSRDPSSNKIYVSTTGDPQTKTETGVSGYLYSVGKKSGYYYLQTSTGIYRLDSAGKNPVTLLSEASYSLQLCSSVIFYSTSDQKNIYKMNYDGSAKTLMHTFPESVSTFTASMSGDKIYYNRNSENAFYMVAFNKPPTLALTQPTDNLTLTEGSTYKLEGSVSDADAGQALSVKYSVAGGPTQSIALGNSDGVTAKSFSKTLTYSQGRFWDGSTDVSGLLPAETASIQVWANEGVDDSAKVTRNFTIQQEDGKLYVPVNVVNQAYLVSQMAPPVRLSNGWLVGAAKDNTTGYTYFYKSLDNGKTWTQLCSITSVNISSLAVASKGTRVYVVGVHNQLSTWSFDAATQTNTALLTKIDLEINQTAYNNAHVAIAPDGTKLWWAASTKNSSYPNSFNIRAGYIQILSDGTLGTPSAVSQLTTANFTSLNWTNPNLTFKKDGYPIIAVQFENNTPNYGIGHISYNGTGWNNPFQSSIAPLGAFLQSSPQIITTPNGKIHVLWQGTDSSDIVNPWIRYSSSVEGIIWPSTPKKIVKGQNASITSDKNGKLTITYEDGGYIKRIESTNEFVSYSGPFTVGAGTKPATFYDQSFQTDFSVPPTFFQASGAVKYYGVLNLNKKPVVTLTTPDNQTLTENATLSVAGSTLDGDPGNVVTTWYKINSGPARALQSGISDGSTPLSFARDLRYSGKRMWDGAVDVAGVDLAENTDHTLAVWAEDDKGGKSAEVTRKFRVVWNRPPTISGQNSDLGTLTERPTVTYSAADPEGNSFTFTEYLNGQQVRSFAGTGGQQNTFELTHDAWIKLDLDVQHQLKIIATDSAGISAERVYTFTRTETHLEFMLDYNNPDVAAFFTVDGMPERILFTLERYLPPDSEIESVLVTNNYLDATPTWEDARNAVIGGRGYIFTNKTKTAADWAICVWVTLAKGSATQRVHVYGYGGAFD